MNKETERAIEILEDNQIYMQGDPTEWAYALAITALRSQGEAERKIERITNVMEYFAESGNHARALYIIQCILDGMTDEEIMQGG